MINLTDFNEFEVSLPGKWIRADTGETWSFTTDKMEFKDERLFRQLNIDQPKSGKTESRQYALTINDEYFGFLVGDKEFLVRTIVKREDGSAAMDCEDPDGRKIVFNRS